MRRAAILLAAALLVAAGEPDPKTETEHRVKPGETLSGIANRAEVPRILIIEANGLKEPYTVRAGQVLIIPRRRSHTVKPGETGFEIALEYGLPWKAIAEANGLDPKKPVRAGRKLAIPTLSKAASEAPPAPPPPPKAPALDWPVDGKLRRGFAARPAGNYHDGVDITARKGTEVRAAAAGTVLFAGTEPKQFGRLVVLDHGNGWTSAYAFLDKITVKEGQKLRLGEQLGRVGSTGQAKGNELHFELRRNNKAVDPQPLMPKSGKD